MVKFSDLGLLGGIKRTLTVLAILIVSVIVILGVTSIIIGVNALEVIPLFFINTVFSVGGLTNTLIKTTPLLIAGLAITVATNCSLWNLGAEGQMALGVILTTGVCLFLDLPAIVLIILSLVMAFIAGALYGGIAGFFKARWGVPEVPITLMLNFIALALLSFLVAGPWLMPGVGYPRSYPIPEATKFPMLAGTLSVTFLMALAITVVVYLFLNRSTLGYKIQAAGKDLSAAFYSGMNVKKLIFASMFISGGLAAIAGSSLVFGEYFRAQSGMTGNYGYYAIVIAVLAKNRVEIVPFASFFVAMIIAGVMSLTVVGVPAVISYFLLGALFIASYLSYGRKS